MNNKQQGLGLIGWVILISILLVVAASLAPNWADKLAKDSLRKVDDFAAPLKTAMVLYNKKSGAFPKDSNAWALLGFPAEPAASEEVSKVTITPETGAFVLTLQNIGGVKKADTTVTMTPTVNEGGIVWKNSCTGDRSIIIVHFQCWTR